MSNILVSRLVKTSIRTHAAILFCGSHQSLLIFYLSSSLWLNVFNLATSRCGKHKNWKTHNCYIIGHVMPWLPSDFWNVFTESNVVFPPLTSLLFFSDLNRTTNQLSFWSSPRSILMAAWHHGYCVYYCQRTQITVFLFFFWGKEPTSEK